MANLSMTIKISAILLAAGLSQRMGRDKLLLDYNGKSILQHSVDLLFELPVFECILVTTDVRLSSLFLISDVRVYINSQPERGLSSSIHIGVENAAGTHYLFLTADQPKLKKADIIQLIEAVKENPDKIIYPVIDAVPCSPTIFPESFREELLKLYNSSQEKQNDNGGRCIRDANKHRNLPIEPANPANFIDIDNIEDYKNLIKE
jgi:molybdenum cofactor cytidylyltransferase